MAVKYERVIERLKVDQVSNTTGAIVSVDWWHHSLDDDMCHGSIRRSTDLSPPDPKKFIDYANLTPEMVFSWIDAARTDEDRKNDLNELKQQMKDRLSPVDHPPLPWDQSVRTTLIDKSQLRDKWDKKLGINRKKVTPPKPTILQLNNTKVVVDDTTTDANTGQ